MEFCRGGIGLGTQFFCFGFLTVSRTFEIECRLHLLGLFSLCVFLFFSRGFLTGEVSEVPV